MGLLGKLGDLLGRSADGRARQVQAECTSTGDGLYIEGSPFVENEGRLVLGHRVTVSSRFAPTRLRVGEGASLTIGDDARIGFGAVVSASREITIGERVRLEPYVFVVDANMGDPDMGAEHSDAVPIHIDDDVTLGARSVVLKGARIGRGAVVTPGSVVSGVVPPHAVVSGNPGQVVRVAQPNLAHQMLFAAAALHPNKLAVISGSRELTYAALCERVRTIAATLARGPSHVDRDEPVLFLCAAKADFIAVFYACLAAGAVAVPVPDGAARATVVDLADACGARTIVSDRATLATFDPPLDETRLRIVYTEDIAPRVTAPPPAGIAPSSPAMILFTSGTTAKKKAVLLSHANIVQATLNINAFVTISEQTREYVAVPLYHSFGLGRVRAVLAVGGTLVLADGPLNPAAMIQTIERHRVNALSTVPAGLAMFSGKLEQVLRRIGPQIDVIELGSAFMSPQQKAALCEIFPRARVCMHYGLTEASRSTFLEFRSESTKLDTVGKASPNVTVEIREQDRVCATGEQGEIVIRGAHVTAGYFRDEERTRASFTHDGAFRTGDFGFLDGEGYVHLLGRKDEMINKGGIKISPLELEDKLREAYPELDFCVVGVPDPEGLAGEVPVMAYVASADLSLHEVLAALAQKVERSKLPSAITRVESIPRTANGKPMRRVLKEQLSNA
jgi:long-chain acyl-CoA synthetase